MRWYLNRTGAAEGPYDEPTIVGMIQRGEVAAGAHIGMEGAPAWAPIGSHPPFLAALSAGAAGPAVPKTMAIDSSAFQHLAPVRAPASAPGAAAPALAASHAAPSHAAPTHAAPTHTAPTHAASRAAAPNANRARLLVGAGCGALLLLAVCGGGGTIAYVSLATSDFADEVNLAANDLLAASEGRTSDLNHVWDNSGGGGETLDDTDEEARSALRAIGSDPEIVFTGIELRAVAGAQRVVSVAIVFPDGRVRYSRLRSEEQRIDPSDPLRSFPRYFDAQTRLASGVDTLLELAAESCEDLELVTSEDLEGLPSELREDILRDSGTTERDALCTTVRASTRDAFDVTMIGGMSVLVRSGDSYALLRSRFRAPENNPNLVFLTPVSVRPVRDGEEAPSATAAAAPAPAPQGSLTAPPGYPSGVPWVPGGIPQTSDLAGYRAYLYNGTNPAGMFERTFQALRTNGWQLDGRTIIDSGMYAFRAVRGGRRVRYIIEPRAGAALVNVSADP